MCLPDGLDLGIRDPFQQALKIPLSLSVTEDVDYDFVEVLDLVAACCYCLFGWWELDRGA